MCVLDAGADFCGSADGLCVQGYFPGCGEDRHVSNIETIQMIAAKLKEYHAKNIVVDPVMVSTSGCTDAAGCHGYTDFCSASDGDIITPNIPEAEKLCGFEIKNVEDMKKSSRSDRQKSFRQCVDQRRSSDRDSR